MVGFDHWIVAGRAPEPELRHEAVLGECSEGSVDRGQADLLALAGQGPVEVLRRRVVSAVGEGLEDPLPLGGEPVHAHA